MSRTRLLLAALSVALVPVARGAAPPAAVVVKPFTLDDLSGKPWTLPAQGKATIVVFLSCECPMSSAYLKPLGDLAAGYEKRGVRVLGVRASKEESAAAWARHVKEYGVSFPVLEDRERAAVRALGATTYPEAFLLDARGAVRYRGRIDGSFVTRRM